MDWTNFLLSFAAFLLSLSFHESAHAWTAWRLGDPTGRSLGRITLNPLPHIDPFGTILLPLMLAWGSHGQVVFGYAKPVPYNPFALRNPPLGSAAIAGAGPASNLLLAGVAALALGFVSAGGDLRGTLGQDFLLMLLFVNVGLAVFNLVPVPPLDGGTILAGLLPRPLAAAFARIEQFGFLILIGLMYTGTLTRITRPVTSFLVLNLLEFARGLRG